MSLQNLQAEIAEAILAGDHHCDLIQPATHLSIYLNNITSHLLKAMINTYPMIRQLVGDAFFQIAAKSYIEQYPARTGNLNEYGEYFSDFLSEYDSVSHLPYLPDMAKLEWSIHLIYSAPDHVPLNIDTLRNYAPDAYAGLYFILHPASRLIRFHYPVLDIMALCQSERDEPIQLEAVDIPLLIIRRDQEISYEPLSKGEFTFLTTLQNGGALAEALQYAVQEQPDFDLEYCLPQRVQDKTIVDCYSL